MHTALLLASSSARSASALIFTALSTMSCAALSASARISASKKDIAQRYPNEMPPHRDRDWHPSQPNPPNHRYQPNHKKLSPGGMASGGRRTSRIFIAHPRYKSSACLKSGIDYVCAGVPSRAAILVNCSRAASRSSAISAAKMSGAGNASVSVRLLSLIQNRFETELVPLQNLVIIIATPPTFGIRFAPGFHALVRQSGLVTGNELVKVPALDGLLLEREMLVGAQIVDP